MVTGSVRYWVGGSRSIVTAQVRYGFALCPCTGQARPLHVGGLYVLGVRPWRVLLRRSICSGCGGERAVRHCAAFRLLGRVIVPAVMRFGRDGHSRRLCGRDYGPLRGVDGGALAPWGGKGGY